MKNPMTLSRLSRVSPVLVGVLVWAAVVALGLSFGLMLTGCGPGSPGGSAGDGGGGNGGGAAGGSWMGDACHSMADLSCTPDASHEAGSCAMYFGGSHPDPLVCEQVTPAGNCLPLDEFTADHASSCEGGSIAGDVWCCGPDSSASCAPFDDAACDGASSEDLAGRCVVAFGGEFSTPYTCAPDDGPATCKNLSRFSTALPTCGGEPRVLWCCTSDGL